MTTEINGIRLITMKSSDLGRTSRFYRGLFGWDCQSLSDTFLGFDAEFGPSGGFILSHNPISDNSMTLYVEVTEISAARSKAVELGGTALGNLVAVPEFGSYALIRDPDGNRIGLWKSEPEAQEVTDPDELADEPAEEDRPAPPVAASTPSQAPGDSAASFAAALADEADENDGVFADPPPSPHDVAAHPAAPRAKAPPPPGQPGAKSGD